MSSNLKLNLQNRNFTKGFTLLELLVASAMTLGIITIAGIAIANITKGNLKSGIESQVQYDLNRTLEFISTELRKASSISTQPQNAPSTSGVPANTFPTDTNIKYILLLNNNNLSAPIVYYTLPRDSTNVTQNWLLSKGEYTNLVLYRWGPSVDATGNYENQTTPSSWGAPVPVADALSSDNNTATCATGWSLIPSSGSKKGLYLCVKPIGTTNTAKQITIYANGKAVSDRISQNKNGANGNIVNYEIKTQIYTRSSSN